MGGGRLEQAPREQGVAWGVCASPQGHPGRRLGGFEGLCLVCGCVGVPAGWGPVPEGRVRVVGEEAFPFSQGAP